MRFNPFRKESPKSKDADLSPKEDNINQGIFYLYLIIGAQVAFVFGLLAVIMVIGRVLATPIWVFLFAFLVAVGGLVYIYRKAKRQFQRFREAFQKVDFSQHNYEISVMGGLLTMRVEQNPRRLLEAPSDSVIEGETIETPAAN